MDISKIIWTKDSYDSFVSMMFQERDLKYQVFHSKLILDSSPVIGIKTPVLKNWAKQITKTNYQDFLALNPHKYYEEIVLHGLILGYLSIDFKDLLSLLEKFLPYNTNWAINDIVCSNTKAFKKNLEPGFIWILNCLETQDTWKIRFGLVLLLDYYINDTYIDSILKLCQKQYIDTYYVNMALSWLISICYIHYPEKTLPLLEKRTLNPFIHQKAISKICDSYRVSNKEKDYLKKIR